MVSLRTCMLICSLMLICFSNSAFAVRAGKDKKPQKGNKAGKDKKKTKVPADNTGVVPATTEVCTNSIDFGAKCGTEGVNECLHMKACCCGTCRFLGSCSCNADNWECMAVSAVDCLINCPDEEVIFVDAPIESSAGCPSGSSFPQVVGLSGEDAKTVIEMEEPCLSVEIIAEGSPVTMDYRLDRVRIFVNEAGLVVMAPLIG